jgi:hypothetical protein
MHFDVRDRAFIGVAPIEVSEELTIMVVASDVDGMEATSYFKIRREIRMV